MRLGDAVSEGNGRTIELDLVSVAFLWWHSFFFVCCSFMFWNVRVGRVCFFSLDNESWIYMRGVRVYWTGRGSWSCVVWWKLAVYVHKCRFCGHKDECFGNKLSLFIFQPPQNLSNSVLCVKWMVNFCYYLGFVCGTFNTN